jgi:Zn-dependent peptidase ImmA (M78 family)
MLRELLKVAARYDVEVHAAHLPGDLLGCYLPDSRRIYIDLRLTPAERRSVLAHELGHAHYGHSCDSPSAERQAEAFAARLLIDPDTYAAHERVSHDEHHLADELNVTVELVRAYRAHCLTRLQGVSYARAKMGAGQWAFRGAHA